MAVDLAQRSLWLVMLAKDHPFTFLDHALRHGESRVAHLAADHRLPLELKKQKQFGEDTIQQLLDQATEALAKVLAAREDEPYRDQEDCLALGNWSWVANYWVHPHDTTTLPQSLRTASACCLRSCPRR